MSMQFAHSPCFGSVRLNEKFFCPCSSMSPVCVSLPCSGRRLSFASLNFPILFIRQYKTIRCKLEYKLLEKIYYIFIGTVTSKHIFSCPFSCCPFSSCFQIVSYSSLTRSRTPGIPFLLPPRHRRRYLELGQEYLGLGSRFHRLYRREDGI